MSAGINESAVGALHFMCVQLLRSVIEVQLDVQEASLGDAHASPEFCAGLSHGVAVSVTNIAKFVGTASPMMMEEFAADLSYRSQAPVVTARRRVENERKRREQMQDHAGGVGPIPEAFINWAEPEGEYPFAGD